MAHDHHDHDHHHHHAAEADARAGAGGPFALDHVNLRTTRLETMIDWYDAVLGLRPGPRPDFPFPGAWLYAGAAPLVHLVGIEKEPMVDPDALKLEHFALRGRDLDAFLTHVHALGETFRLGRAPGVGIAQVNLWDPDGNHIHVDFAEKPA